MALPAETVCVTVVCLNRLDSTKRTLATFVESAKQDSTPFRLMLVDNGSTDGTPAYLVEFAEANPQLSVFPIRLDKPTNSISEAVNRGWYEGRECGYFVKLDNDIIPNPAWLGRMKAMLDAEPMFGEIGICVTPSPNGLHAVLNKTRYFKAHLNGGREMLWGACIMVRVDVLKKVGVLHEGMPRDEDREFSTRIVDAGYVIGYLPNGERAQHIGGMATESDWKLRQRKFVQGTQVWMKTPKGTIQRSRWGSIP